MSDLPLPHDLTPNEAGGMTVNERLWAAGLLDVFDEAIERKNETRFREICQRVFLGPENIQALVDKYFSS
jgi:hypothetical protein